MGLFEEKKSYIKTEELQGMKTGAQEFQNDDMSMYKNAYRDVMQDNNKLQTSKDTSWWFTRDDSPQMENIKKAQADLMNFYENESISSDNKTFLKQKAMVVEKYQRIRGFCAIYLENHKSPKSKSGKARKRMVNRLLKQATREKAKFSNAADEVYQSATESVSWFNVLVAVRGYDLNQADFEVSYTGGHESVVTVLKKDDKKIFFKDEERVLSVGQEMRKRFESDPDLAKYKKKLKNFLNFLENTDFNTVQSIAGQFRNLASLTDVEGENYQEDAKDFFDNLRTNCDMDEVAYPIKEGEQEAVLAFLTKYGADLATALTKMGSCNEARIDMGSIVSNRNVATSRMARLLGCEKLICKSENVNLHCVENGKEIIKKGNAMAGSTGSSIDKILEEAETIVVTPEVYRQMNCLQLFDIICGQVDRNGSNILYNYEIRMINGKKTAVLTSLQGIDNDISFGKLAYEDIIEYPDGLMKMKNVEQKDGSLNIASIDESVASYIMDCSPEKLKAQLVDILTPDEINAAVNRLQGIQRLLIKKGDQIVRRKEDFTKKQYEEDVKAGYNKTTSSYYGAYLLQYGMVEK